MLELLKSGKAIDMLELGTLYIKPEGSIEGENPSIEDVPPMTLGFTPSTKALDAVKDVAIAANISKKNLPEIERVFNVKSRSDSDEINAGYSIKIFGKRLRIGGEEETTGVFFAPCDENGNYDKADKSKYLHIKASELVENSSSMLECNVPDVSEKGKYRLIITTAYRTKKENSKIERTGEYENIITIS